MQLLVDGKGLSHPPATMRDVEGRPRYRLDARPAAPVRGDGAAGTKRCSGCKLSKPLDDFYMRDWAKGVRQNYCKACKSEYNRQWYHRNRDKHIADVMKNNVRYRAKIEALVGAAKDNPCADCGERFPPEAMDFDHVKGEKVDAISSLVRRMCSLAELEAELEKCELVCSNCHRVRTMARLRDN